MNFDLLTKELDTNFINTKANHDLNIKKIRVFDRNISIDKNTLYFVNKDEYDILKKSEEPSNYFVFTNDSKFITSELINNVAIISSEMDIFDVFSRTLKVIDKYNELYENLYKMVAHNINMNDIMNYLKDFLGSKLCIFNNNKKLVYNIFDFKTVNNLYPLKTVQANFTRMYGYLGFEHLDNKYDKVVENVIYILKDYILYSINDILNTNDNFYDTLKNLIKNDFNQSDVNALKSIGWDLNDEYKLILINLDDGLYKYRDMFVHGNRFILDHPMYLYSAIVNSQLILLINEKNKDLKNINNSIMQFIDEYELRYVIGNLKNNLMNFNKTYLLCKWILDNPFTKITHYEDNITDVIYDMACVNKFIDILIPENIYKIIKEDEENNTELLKTLYYYLLEERSLKKAGEQLQVHRNSIVYRMGKVDEITKLNLESAEARRNILSALELIKRIYPEYMK